MFLEGLQKGSEPFPQLVASLVMSAILNHDDETLETILVPIP